MKMKTDWCAGTALDPPIFHENKNMKMKYYWSVGLFLESVSACSTSETALLSADNELCCPWAVSADEDNHIYVADGWNERVLVLHTSGQQNYSDFSR